MNTPLVSVVIPTYRCGTYLRQAIESVFNQTYQNIELIVVDSSPDETQAILKPYLDRITYLIQEPRGVSAARNLGLRHTRGKLVAFQDGDDIWLPDRLSIQMQALKQYPEAALVFADYETFDESGVVENSVRYLALRRWFESHRIDGTDWAFGQIYHELLLGNCIGTCTVLVRQDVLDNIGPFDERLEVCEDYDVWLRLAVAHPVLYIGEVLSRYRIRPDGLSGSIQDRRFHWSHARIRVREKQLRNHLVPEGSCGLVKDIQSWDCWDLGYRYFSQNRLRDARAAFLRGLKYRPLRLLPWLYWGSCFLPVPIVSAIRRGKHVLPGLAAGPIRW